MSIQTELAILKSELADLKMKKMDLAARIHGNVRAAKALLAAANIKPIERIDVEGASQQLLEAAKQKREMAEVVAQIEKIEAELN